MSIYVHRSDSFHLVESSLLSCSAVPLLVVTTFGAKRTRGRGLSLVMAFATRSAKMHREVREESIPCLCARGQAADLSTLFSRLEGCSDGAFFPKAATATLPTLGDISTSLQPRRKGEKR